MKMDQADRSKPTLRAYIVGIYLFSVPAFAYSESLGLSIIPQVLGALLVTYAIFDVVRNQAIKFPLKFSSTDF